MNYIADKRRALGLTQSDLAAKLREIDPRIDASMISRFESEACFPGEAVLSGLERALQADRSDLYAEIELFIIPEKNREISPITARVAEALPFGEIVSREELAQKLGKKDRDMREAVSTARREGIVIINDQGGRGYYRSEDLTDLKRQLRQTHNRALALLAQERYIKDRIRAAEGS